MTTKIIYRPGALFPLLCGLLCGVNGCKDLTGSQQLPAGTPNPSIYNNATGALGMRNAAVSQFGIAAKYYLLESGMLTDELEDANTGVSVGILQANQGVKDGVDERILPDGGFIELIDLTDSYDALQNVRAFADQALGALAAYDTAIADTAAVKVQRSELYAFEGFAEIMLADLYCSGVPLSTLDFGKDFTYAPSSTTTQVYQAALAKFDTALTLAKGRSDSVVYMALIGMGRANMDLGNYATAADDVTTVPGGFVYQVWMPAIDNSAIVGSRSWTVSDQEGHNGLPYRFSGDPRTAVEPYGINFYGQTAFTAKKYLGNINATIGAGYEPFTVASGIEGKLIEAESALQPADAAGGAWLDTLNALRANAAVWTGGQVPALPANLTDPGASLVTTDPRAAGAARIALLFRERAYWLFLDGHRQGDLRRLLRQYGKTYSEFNDQAEVYPTGSYLAPGTGTYGSDMTVPIPSNEAVNPLFHGCQSRTP